MKAILHIGTEKTGSTALQHFLYDNQVALNDHSFYLPADFGRPNNHKFSAFFSADPERAADHPDPAKEDERFRGAFEDFLSGLPQDATVILTSEHFHSRVTSRDQVLRLRRFLERYFEKISIVCYFREQSSMAISLYSTVVKIRRVESLEEFVSTSSVNPENYYYNFYDIAENWSSVFGLENCTFRIFARKRLIGGDIRQDFLQIVGLDEAGFEFGSSVNSANESLSYLHCLIFRKVNQIMIPGAGKPREVTIASDLKSTYRSLVQPTGQLSPGNELLIYQSFLESNAKFFDKFIGSDEVFPAPKIVEDDRVAQLRDETTAVAIDQILTASLQNVRKTHAELKRVEAELAETRSTLRSTIRYPWKHAKSFWRRNV